MYVYRIFLDFPSIFRKTTGVIGGKKNDDALATV